MGCYSAASSRSAWTARSVRWVAVTPIRSKHSATIGQMDLLITLFSTPNSIVAECFERIGVTATHLTDLAVQAERELAAE